MSAARLTGEAHQFGAGLQRTRIELRPAHRVVDVLHGGRIRVLVARAEIERNRDDAVLGHGFMAEALGVRSLRHQAPPWHSTSAGNGPCPRGRNTRASSGLSP